MKKTCFAELVGTMALVIFGCGTAMLVGCNAAAGRGYLLTALAGAGCGCLELDEQGVIRLADPAAYGHVKSKGSPGG